MFPIYSDNKTRKFLASINISVNVLSLSVVKFVPHPGCKLEQQHKLPALTESCFMSLIFMLLLLRRGGGGGGADSEVPMCFVLETSMD